MANSDVCSGTILAGKDKGFNEGERCNGIHRKIAPLAGRLEAGRQRKASAKGQVCDPWLRHG